MSAKDNGIFVASYSATAHPLIPIQHSWLSLEPADTRADIDGLLARVVQSFSGGAVMHSAYIFTNKSANRLKVLVYDGAGIWLYTRRLQSGRFVWPRDAARQASISAQQLSCSSRARRGSSRQTPVGSA